jgi:hypothetical protein
VYVGPGSPTTPFSSAHQANARRENEGVCA